MIHRTRHIHEQHGLACQHFLCSGALQHQRFKDRLELWHHSRSRDEAEWKDALDIERTCIAGKRCIADSGLLHVAKVAQKSQRSKLLLRHQPFEGGFLVGTTRQRDFPCIRRDELTVDQTLP